MKKPQEVFLEVLQELGFDKCLPSQLTNSDYWLCTTTAMERYAELANGTTREQEQCNIAGVSKRSELLIGLLEMLEKEGGNNFIDKAEIVAKYEANL